MSILDWIAKILVIIGGLNWGLIGVFQLDLVAIIFNGSDSMISRVIYTLVGLSAVWMLYKMFGKKQA